MSKPGYKDLPPDDEVKDFMNDLDTNMQELKDRIGEQDDSNQDFILNIYAAFQRYQNLTWPQARWMCYYWQQLDGGPNKVTVRNPNRS